jgi:hypothetical protein
MHRRNGCSLDDSNEVDCKRGREPIFHPERRNIIERCPKTPPARKSEQTVKQCGLIMDVHNKEGSKCVETKSLVGKQAEIEPFQVVIPFFVR